MASIHWFALVSIALCFGCYLAISKKWPRDSVKISSSTVFLVLGLGLIARLIIAAADSGFSYDIASFGAWAERMYSGGPANFYSPDVLTDYPPLYMYVLYVIGFLRSALSIEWLSPLHLVLLKLPAILFDLAISYVLFRVASKRLDRFKALFLMSAYLFLPGVIINSAAWGQVDSPHTLMIVLMCLFLIKGKTIPAYVVYAIGVLFKPQTLIFTPILLIGIVDHVFLKDFRWSTFVKNLSAGLLTIGGMVLLSLPFGLDNVLRQYVDTLGSYAYATVNAYNFWALFSMSWVSQDTTFLFLPASTWGTIVILLIVATVFYLSFRFKHQPVKYPLLGVYIALTMFLFSVRMHERYSYPAFALLILAFILWPKKRLWYVYTFFGALYYENTAHVLYFYTPENYDRENPLILLISAGMLLLYVYFMHVLGTYVKDAKLKMPQEVAEVRPLWHRFKARFFTPLAPVRSREQVRMTRIDLLILSAITLLYSGFALYDLGDRDAPKTTFDVRQHETIHLEFSEPPTTLSYYLAPPHAPHFDLAYKQGANDTWIEQGETVLQNVFTWSEMPLPDGATELYFTLTGSSASLLEWTFTRADGMVLTPLNADQYAALFDESHFYPERATFRNGMYFDEIYHGRTAYEFINGLPTYETTHPPFGKSLIALGVRIFGMNPFGWRVVGTLFGIAMLWFLYAFAKRMLKNTPLAALATFLFAFDFMHFTQTRIATIDTYAAFFVIAMYYFMYRYTTLSFFDTPLRRMFIPLGLSGIAFGFGVANKWTGLYAGLGLAILFFASLVRRLREYLYAKASPREKSEGIEHEEILRRFFPAVKKTIGFCLIFFLLIPGAIYVLSYLPFVDSADRGLIARMLHNQSSMFKYHSTLDETHAYSSMWIQWPILTRPIWYYAGYVSESLREGISAFGNPLVWWAGIPAFFYQIKLLFTKKVAAEPVSRDDLYTSAFLVTGYLAVYLPWVFVSRLTFIYHYFLAVPFVVLMIAHSLMMWKRKVTDRHFLLAIGAYAVGAFLLFILFYPVLSGQPIDKDFAVNVLRWLPGWVLISP